METSDNKWFKDAIVYHILIDRFAGYDHIAELEEAPVHGRKPGGQYLTSLSYLHDLGINTIWLSPVFKNTAYHGYHITDFYSTDKRFGTEQELSDLIRKAHYLNIQGIA